MTPMRVGLLCFAAALCAAGAVNLEGSQARPGLQVNSKGILVKDGKPYRGIGVNYYNAFYRCLNNPQDTSYREGFKTLSEKGIPFVRFSACGFWPVDYKMYREDRANYFRVMDQVVKAAEEYHIGLIPSFFWFYAAVPDLVGEPMDAWGDPKSKTIEFMRTYTREVVMRYHNSPAIWGWEFGNEFSLSADLPNASDHRPHIQPSLGTPTTRTERDDLTHAMIQSAFVEFAKEVRKYDKTRIVITGNSFPRPSAWHQQSEHSWTQDSQAQYAEMLLADNPDPVNTVSAHMYNDMPTRFGKTITYDELLRMTMGICAKAKKPLFVGEFGAQKGDDPESTKKLFSEMLSAIEKTGVPLAALWVFDYNAQDKDWNVTATNDRAYQLTALAEANRRISKSAR
jgi:hypothetical protein